MERLSSLIEYMVDNRGKNPPYYSESGIPIIDTFLIGESKYPDSTKATRFIDDFLFENFIRCKNKKDDLLITLVGNGYGNSSLCNEKQIIIQNAVGLRFKKNVSQLYIYYFFKQGHIKKWIQNLDRGSAQPNVKVSDLLRMKIALPLFIVQKSISTMLDNYDQLIENNNKRIKLLESMAEELYKEWFVRFRFPGYENVEFENGIPQGWKYTKFADVCSFVRGISYSSDEIENQEADNILVNLKNIRDFGGFRKENYKKYDGDYRIEQKVNKFDLVMAVTEMVQERRIIGYVGLIPTYNQNCVISADLIKIISDYNNIFLYSLFVFGGASLCFSQYGNGTNVIHLKPSSLKNIKLLIPKKQLINNYVEIAKKHFELIDQLQLENERLIQQRDSLLPRLMSGKLSVEGKEIV